MNHAKNSNIIFMLGYMQTICVTQRQNFFILIKQVFFSRRTKFVLLKSEKRPRESGKKTADEKTFIPAECIHFSFARGNFQNCGLSLNVDVFAATEMFSVSSFPVGVKTSKMSALFFLNILSNLHSAMYQKFDFVLVFVCISCHICVL